MQGSVLRSVPSLYYTSTADRPSDRFEIWRNVMRSLHDLSPADGEARDALSVESSVWNIDGVVAVHGRYSALRGDRNAVVVRRSGLENYRLTVLLNGTIGLESANSRRNFERGDLVVTDLASTNQFETKANESVVLFLPRSAVDALLPRSTRLHGLVPQGPLAGLLRDHVLGLVQALRMSIVPAEAAPALAQATLQLFVAAVAGIPSLEEGAHEAVESTLRRRIETFIEAHLLDPDLSQEKLCGIFHMSRATLYRLFRPLGGVAAHVQARRLARIHAELLDPSRHHHLGRLAETHGFVSQAHMSRAYKARYGHSPSETYVPGESGASEPVAEVSGGPEQQRYERWLRMARI